MSTLFDNGRVEPKKKCTMCRWHDNSKGVNCTGFFGNKDADVVFVGEAFGRDEAEVGEAFVGRAGEELNKLLKMAGLRREDVAIMNAMRCYQEGNPTPTKKELDTCFRYVYWDLLKIKPKLIVALGASAFYSLTGRDDFSYCRGHLIESEKLKLYGICPKVFVTYHPAAILYDRGKVDEIEKDFRKISSYIDKDVVIKHFKYEFIQNPSDFRDVFNRLINSKILYFDLETTGLNPYKDEITTLQLSDGSEPIYVIDGDILKDIRDELRELFSRCKVAGQDYAYDARFLKVKLGVFPDKWGFDTCLAEYVISGMKDNDLNFLVKKYTPEYFGYWIGIKESGYSKGEKLYQYGADDVGVLPFIEKEQRKILKRDETFFLNKILIPANKVLTKMSIRGVKYDVEKVKSVDRKYKKKADKLLYKVKTLKSVKTCERHFGEPFNPRSNDHVKWLLLEYYKLPVLKETRKGNPSIGIEEMKKYAKEYDNEYCKIMKDYRSIQNIRSNFLSGVLPKLVGDVAHTTYSSHASATGRPNSKNPNLLNIPRESDVRSCLVARNGNVFVCADYKQLEVRIASVIYHDPKMIEICNDDSKDFHCAMTAQAFGKDYDWVYDGYKKGIKEIVELRVAGKGVTFGVIYQETPKGLAYSLGVSVDKAKEFIGNFYRNFPDLKKNIDKVKDFVNIWGYYKNYFGFTRRWKGVISSDNLREAVNFPIQSTAYNILQLAMVELDKRLDEMGISPGLVMQVYDSLVVECREKNKEIVGECMKDVMESIHLDFPILNEVKLRIDLEWGYNLGELMRLEI